ncbi:MAG: hypothetical protein JRD00_07040 [Deltaproteobacteria bacterium]|nr:hypothetical protein [Deltaproteobacteria bacterium]
MAQKVKDAAYQAFLTEQAAKAEKQCKIKCPSCGEIRLQTTSLFRSDKAVTGIMIELLPGLSQTGWSAKFGPTDTGEAIVCPNCNSVLLDHDSFRFSEGVLVDTEDVEAA